MDYNGELSYSYQGHPYTGVAFEDVPGKWYTEINFEDGWQAGWAREWLPSGVLKSEAEYRYNILHGETRKFEKGHLRSREKYEFGILVKREDVDPQGRVVCEWEISADDSLYQLLVKYRSSRGWPDSSSDHLEGR